MYGFDDNEAYRRLEEMTRSIQESNRFMTFVPDFTLFSEQLRIAGQVANIKQLVGLDETALKRFTASIPAYNEAHNKLGLMAMQIQNQAGIGENIKAPLVDTLRELNLSASTVAERSNLVAITESLRHFNVLPAIANLYSINPGLTSFLGDSFIGVDFEALGRAANKVLANGSLNWEDNGIFQTIADDYNNRPIHTVRFDSKDEKIEDKRKLTVQEVREWLNTILTIISLLLSISKQPTTVNYYNITNVYNTNHYYVAVQGYDPVELNSRYYRIVNQNIIIRQKHDCHSRIIGYLYAGDIVRMVNADGKAVKYKKWRKIWWDDDDGEYSGWIQNWKLEEFKKVEK